MRTRTAGEASAANPTDQGAGVIASDPGRSNMEKVGERLLTAAVIELNAIGLAQHGWTQATTADLRARIAELAEVRMGQAVAGRVVAQAMSDRATVQQAATVNRDRLAYGFRLLSLRSQLDVPANFFKVEATTRSPDLLRVWMKRARVLALKARPQLTVHLGGDPIEVIDATVAGLISASRGLKAARRALEALVAQGQIQTKELNVAIDSLLWVARTAFRNDPSTLRRFRKDLRVHRAKPAAEQPQAETAKEPNAGDPTAA